jgi:hypothetical protein
MGLERIGRPIYDERGFDHYPDFGLTCPSSRRLGPRFGEAGVMTRPKAVVISPSFLSPIPLFDRDGHSFVPT